MKKSINLVIIFIILLNALFYPLKAESATMRYFDNVKSEDFPSRLKENLKNQPWEDGFIDITKSPYNAKGDGKSDDTLAIQNAIDDAYASNLIVYFPLGTYVVSKQLTLNQYPANYFQADQGVKFDSQRKFGNLLVGSTKNGQRPKIVLKDNSSVDDNILLLYRYHDPRTTEVSTSDRGKHYIATFRGIDVDMGNNPNVSGISMDGAQYCTIQDTNITGISFYAGIKKIPGATGSLINVNVNGGDIGILSDSYVPEALVAGVVLENQKNYGIKVINTRNSPVNLVGFKIVSPDDPSTNYRGVYLDDREATAIPGANDTRAHITMTDGTIEVKGDKGVAIETYNQFVVLNNVYIKSNTIINAGIKNEVVEKLGEDKDNWRKIKNYAFTSKDNNGFININNTEFANKGADSQYYDEIKIENPSEDFVGKHIWPVKMPSYDDIDKVNIVTEYGATPYNNEDDDAIAIQKAINDTTTVGNKNFGKKVFIPRGHFQVRSTITLKKGTKIFGAGKNISVIHQNPKFKIDGESYIVDTDTSGDVVMTDFAILRQESSESLGLINNKNTSMLRIQGNNTVFRDIQFAGVEDSKDNYYLRPEVVITGNAGGKIYNLSVNTTIRAVNNGNIHGDYRRVLIEGVKNPLQIYQCGVNNVEKAFELEINKSSNVSIYALYYEEQNQLLKIKDSSNISVIGGYGYYTVVDNIESIIKIENSKNINLAGLCRSSMRRYVERADKDWVLNGTKGLKDDFDIVLYKTSTVNTEVIKNEAVLNNKFEDGISNWSTTGSANIIEENNKVYEGNKAIKVTNRKTADDGLVQDISKSLKASGPGKYNLTTYLMRDSKLNTKIDEIGSKSYIKVEIKHDGITEKFTLEDKGFYYWNRISGILDLKWTDLQEAKIYIVNSDLENDYYVDNTSVYKVNDKIPEVEDIDKNDKVNIIDLGLVAAKYRVKDILLNEDINGDGVIDIFDLVMVAKKM